MAAPYLFTADARLSFTVLLPPPLNVWCGSVGREHQQAFPGNQMDWARQNWGTKWDAYGGPKARSTTQGTVLTFQTAWSHPRGWVCALFNTLNCRITAHWLDEGSADGVSEYYTISDGGVGGCQWHTEQTKEGSPRHRMLHRLLWGCARHTDEDED